MYFTECNRNLKGSNKMFTRTIEGYCYFRCPTCFRICKNITEVLKHLLCKVKPPKLSDSLLKCHIIEALHKHAKNFLDLKLLNSLLPSTSNQFPIPCKPEAAFLHIHFCSNAQIPCLTGLMRFLTENLLLGQLI